MSELATRRAPITAVDTATRTITARLVTWDNASLVRDPDGRTYRETFARGALEPLADTYVVDEHHGNLIGHMENHRDDGDGHVADLRIADTVAGRDLLALVDAGTIRHVSIEFDHHQGDTAWNATRDAVTRRAGVPLHGVAFAFRPAHTSPILSVREQEPQPMTTVMPDVPMPTPTVTVTPADAEDVLALRAELVAVRDELATRALAGVHPLARYGSFREFALAAFEDRLASRALADQITTNNPGVIPPGWLRDVKGIVSFGRPGITAVGGPAPLPDSGMDVNWPYYDGTLTDLVGVQATQKTAITSARVDLKKGTEAIKTFAGGSDISYQLIRRSDPSYMEAYLRIMTAAYAAVTENDFVDSLVADSTASIDLPVGSATAATVRAALFQASATIFGVTGQPATAVIASLDWFLKLGGLDGLWPAAYGTQNVTGTAQASTLEVNVSGLRVAYSPYIASGNMIVTNGAAARWHEDGPMVVSAPDVEKLGDNVAVWGMGAAATYLPGAVVRIYDVP